MDSSADVIINFKNKGANSSKPEEKKRMHSETEKEFL